MAGGYADWEAKRRAPAAAARAASRSAPPPPPAPAAKARKLSYKDQRDLERLPGLIETMESDIVAGETALSDPDLYTRDPGLFDRLTKALDAKRAEKDKAEERWLELAAEAEALES